MLKTKGGYIIFDLMALALAVTESATDIEDESILKQLYSLLPYFLNKEEQLKPIYLRVKDSDGVESVVLAELVRSDEGIKIHAKVLDSELVINVAYEQDADTLEWSIDSATYDYLSDSSIIESVAGEVIESGLVDNAKPIYCHPINIQYTDNNSTHIGRIGCLIFNNGETPFTFESFIQYIKDLYTLVGSAINIVCTGAIKGPSGDGYSTGKLTIIDRITYDSAGYVRVLGIDIDSTLAGIADLEVAKTPGFTLYFSDGVNKIN